MTALDNFADGYATLQHSAPALCSPSIFHRELVVKIGHSLKKTEPPIPERGLCRLDYLQVLATHTAKQKPARLVRVNAFLDVPFEYRRCEECSIDHQENAGLVTSRALGSKMRLPFTGAADKTNHLLIIRATQQ